MNFKKIKNAVIAGVLAVSVAFGSMATVMTGTAEARDARMTQDRVIYEHLHQVTTGIYTTTGKNRCNGKRGDRVRIDATQGNLYLVTNWDRSDKRFLWFFGGVIRCHGWVERVFVR